MNKRIFIVISLILLMAGSFPFTLAAHEEMPYGRYFTLVDENNNLIHQTGTKVNIGDEYISADNGRYKVVEIIGDTARCVYQGEERMPVVNYNNKINAWVINQEEVPAISGKNPSVAVYHTHSDESYINGDGVESKPGNGGIYDVGGALVQRLKKLGFNVEYNTNNHNPHDVNAYSRSRRTAVRLLKQNPDIIIDVHRDAVPPGQYQTEVKGKNVTKVKLVVGRQNPNMKTNMEFAKKLKAVMDKTNPGLSNGIFIGKGDYNQDLSPRAMLIEVGAHTNRKQDAQEGVMLFADTLANVMGLSTGGAPAAKPLKEDNQGSWLTILFILTVLGAAAGGYYILNQRSTNK